MTLEQLDAIGVNTREGLERCLGNESFYFRLIGMAVGDAGFDKLRDAVAAGDLASGFEAAHALKGVAGNLALTPLYEPISEMTELLRARQQADYPAYLEKILAARETLRALCE